MSRSKETEERFLGTDFSRKIKNWLYDVSPCQGKYGPFVAGNASVTDVQNCEAKAPAAPDDGSMVAGGVTEAQTPEVTPDAKAALDKACQGPDGAKYEVKALLGTQVVAGTNYTLLCKITPVVPNASSHYAIVKVYEKPDGSAEISETFDFTPSNNA